jgi:hypothetical protein
MISQLAHAVAAPARGIPVATARRRLLNLIGRHVGDTRSARNLAHVVERFDDDEILALRDLLLDCDVSSGTLAEEIAGLQREHVRCRLQPWRKTVALYYPTPTYREHIAGLAGPLREAGFNVVIALGVVCDDQFEQGPDVHFGGTCGSLTLIESWDFVDLVVSPVLATELPGQAHRVYVLHDIHDSPLGDAAAVQEIATNLQAYDYVFAPSAAVVDVFKQVIPMADTGAAGRRQVTIVPGGYMKLDRFMREFEARRVDAKSLVYAPTVTGYGFDDIGSLVPSGRDIVAALLEAAPDHEVIFRPHPHTLQTDAVRQIVDEFRTNPRFTLDDDASSYVGTYARARLMVSDLSGTAFTYALATLRPVVFCSFNEPAVQRRFGELRYFRDRDRVGYVVRDLERLRETVGGLVSGALEHRLDIAAYREEAVFNPGRTEACFLASMDHFIRGTADRDWVGV